MPSSLFPESMNYDVKGYPGDTDDESDGQDGKVHVDDAKAEKQFVCVEREYHERLKAIKREAERAKEQGPVPPAKEPEIVLTMQNIDLKHIDIIKEREQDLEIVIKKIVDTVCTQMKETASIEDTENTEKRIIVKLLPLRRGLGGRHMTHYPKSKIIKRD